MIPCVRSAPVLLAVVVVGGFASAASSERPGEHVVAGDAAYARADLPGARAAYISALRDESRPYEALCRLARVEMDMAQVQKGEEQRRLVSSAVQRAGAAVQLSPDSALGHLVLAEALSTQCEQEGPRTRLALARQIKAEVDRVLNLDPHCARAYHVRGVWNRNMATRGWWDRAMGRTVMGGQPRGASLANAVQDLQKAIELEPRDVSHHLELARTWTRLHRREEARREAEMALAVPAGATPLDGTWHAQARALLEKLK